MPDEEQKQYKILMHDHQCKNPEEARFSFTCVAECIGAAIEKAELGMPGAEVIEAIKVS